MQATTKRPPMTADEARVFSHQSLSSAMAVALAKQACGCEAYHDVFTFVRWKAQGYYVMRGEHAISLPLVTLVERENEETGMVETRKIFSSSHLFCRCQVARVGYAEAGA